MAEKSRFRRILDGEVSPEACFVTGAPAAALDEKPDPRYKNSAQAITREGVMTYSLRQAAGLGTPPIVPDSDDKGK